MLYGRLPTMRMPAGKRAKSKSSASAQCTVSLKGGKRAASAEARSRSSSIASSLPARSRSGAVSAPSPGPISTSTSPATGETASTMRASTRGSCRKCWPNLFRGRCGLEELAGKLERFGEAAGIGAPGAGKVERRAVIDRGADEGQAERDVDAAAEARILQHRQALVVIHRQHAVGLAQALGHEQRIRGDRPLGVDARPGGARDGRRDHLDVLAPAGARLAAMRVQPGDEDARPRDAEAVLEIGINDPEGAKNSRSGNAARHIGERQMRRGERDP